MRRLRAIHIKSHIYFTTMQDTPAGKQEIEKGREFIRAIEEAASKFLPSGRHSLKIKEEYENS